MTADQTEASPYIVDGLPAAEYLVMETLAARHRLGEHFWTFPTRLRRVLKSLAPPMRAPVTVVTRTARYGPWTDA